MNCPTCKTPMKPLFTGEFCPNNCDKTPVIQRAFGPFRDAIRKNLGLDEDYYIHSLDQPKRDVCPHPDHYVHRGRKGRK